MMITNINRLALAALITATALNLNDADAFLQPSSSTRAFRPRSLLESDVDLQEETTRTTVVEEQDGSERMIMDIPPTPTSEMAEKRARAQKAKETWSTIALCKTSNSKRKEIPLNGESTVIKNQKLFNEFCTIKGTYFMVS